MSTTADTSPASTTRIRPALVSDAERVFALLEQLEDRDSDVSDRTTFDETFAYLVDDANTVLLVAESTAGSVVGYALTTVTPLLHTSGSSAQLQELVVDNDHRETGIGTALVEEVERLCRARDVKQLTVPSRRSAAFYERIGYRSTADFLKRTF